MPKFLQRLRDPIILGALLIVPLVTYLTTGHRGREPNVVDRLILSASAPLQAGLTWVVRSVGGVFSGYLALRGAHEEAQQCGVALSLAHAELNALGEARAENARLRALVGYADSTVEQEIAARVIGLNPSAQFQSIRIDRGEDDGVRAGMPVVTADGVVGQVVRSVGGSADVMLLTDPTSHIGALIQRSRVRGSATGSGDGRLLNLGLVRREEDAQDGDVLVTAGSDGVYPRGLLVGRLAEVKRPPAGMFLTAHVEPAVALEKLEEVLVIPVTLGVPFSSVTRGTR